MEQTKFSVNLMTRLKAFFLVVIVSMVAISCGDDDDGGNVDTGDDIIALAKNTSDLSTLVTALSKFDDLVTTLEGEGTFTVFAPNNAAFTTLLSDLGLSSLDDIDEDVLREILEYHVIASAALESGQLTDGQTAATVEGSNVTVSISSGTVKINDATVSTADVKASNGVVHIIDKVLVPSTVDAVADVVTLAGNNSNLTSLAAALSKFDDLTTTLDGDGPFTIFAPTDEAFAALLEAQGLDDLDDITESVLKEILEYHVVSGSELLSGGLTDGATATTVQGGTLTVGVDGTTITINGANVSTADVKAVNGIIHVIDEVLVPSTVEGVASIVTLASKNEDLSTLVELLTKFPDLVETLSGEGNYTVFAPTNDDFDLLLDEVIKQESFDNVPESVIERVLKYHVVGSKLRSEELTDGQTATTLLEEDITVGVSVGGVTINGEDVATPDVFASNGVIHILDGVLGPELEVSISGTVVAPAYFSKDFTILTEAVVKAELLETLIDENASFTVFAPDNDAFAAAGITSLDGLDKAALEPILLYHVLDSKVIKDDLPQTGSAVGTLNGNFYLSINDDGVFINGVSEVIATDINEDNGVVHVIDKMLTPPSDDVVNIAVKASEATEGAEFGQLVAALTRVENDGSTDNLITILSAAEGGENSAPFTVFAPTDAAFQALYTALGVQDVDGINIGTLEAVLKYHVVAGARVFSTDIPNLEGNATTFEGSAIGFDLETLEVQDAQGEKEAGLVADQLNLLGTNGVIHVIDAVMLPVFPE